MGTSTANTDGRHMSDVAMAQSFVRDIGGNGSVKVMLAVAYDRLSRMFPHRHDPENQWTERRVRGFLSADAATVQYREMVELHEAAKVAKSERSLVEQARKEHAAFIAKTASLRSLLEYQDEAFHRDEIERLRGLVGGMDLPGTDGGKLK